MSELINGNWLQTIENSLDNLENASGANADIAKSSNNSTTTPLNAGQTFTGTADLNTAADVMVYLATDQNGTLYCEFSQDGTNWDTSLSFKYDTARINPPHVLVKGYRYFRARFTNDSASNQTYFRLGVYYGAFQKLTAPINGTLAQNYDAITTRPTDFFTEVAEGKRQGLTAFSKFGYNPDIDSASGEEILAAFGGSWTPLTSAETLDVVSASANDTSAGTGARTILITGVDANREIQTEVVTLNGATPVTTSNTWFGVNRVQVISAGTSGYNEGAITLTASTAATIQASIPAENSISQQLLFHVPSTADAYISRVVLEGAKTSGGSSPKITIKAYQQINGVRYNLFETIMDVSVKAELVAKLVNPVKIAAGSVWWWVGDSDTNDTFLRGRVEQILIDK